DHHVAVVTAATLSLTPPLPAALQVEVTSACNLRCAMCLVRYRPRVNKLAGARPLDLYRRLLDEVPPLRRLTLQGLGEPLLSPYLLDMIRLAKRNGVEVGFNSNATLLTRAKADALVATGLDWLHVSLDGARAGTFEAIRDGTAAEALWTGADRAASAAAFGRAWTLADAAGLELRLPHLSGTPGSRCTWPWDAAYVTSAGIVQPCCMVMGDDRVALGNL